jgi:phytoene synthase
MSRAQQTLDPTYRARAIPVGSTRYWSWLFASAAARAPLLGVFALQAEWNALIDPATEPGAARLKLAWWQEEVGRLCVGTAVHPIGVYLLSLPRAGEVDFAPLAIAIDAAVAETNGAPLERGTDLESHARALRAAPLAVASRLAAADVDAAGLDRCLGSLAAAGYLARAVRDYRRDARSGRVPFAVDELLAAEIDNADLCAAEPPAQLARYLQALRARAAFGYQTAADALPVSCRSQQRHLLVLAALGSKHLARQSTALESGGMRDMLLAWSTARRAHG